MSKVLSNESADSLALSSGASAAGLLGAAGLKPSKLRRLRRSVLQGFVRKSRLKTVREQRRRRQGDDQPQAEMLSGRPLSETHVDTASSLAAPEAATRETATRETATTWKRETYRDEAFQGAPSKGVPAVEVGTPQIGANVAGSSSSDLGARAAQAKLAPPMPSEISFPLVKVARFAGMNPEVLVELLRPSIPNVQTSVVYSAAKRLMDVVGACIGLFLFSPLMLLCAVAIKLQDGGPIFFWQTRIGECGRRFQIVKFRSMVINADQLKSQLKARNEHADDRTFKIFNDPRITPVGRLMRRMSLDEVPQFWNVLCGQMSLVGPRPALADEVIMYEESHLMRLAVKPGLTCIWQVSGRSNLDFQRQMLLDHQYIEQRGIWLDCSLLVKTFPAVLRGDGAA